MLTTWWPSACNRLDYCADLRKVSVRGHYWHVSDLKLQVKNGTSMSTSHVAMMDQTSIPSGCISMEFSGPAWEALERRCACATQMVNSETQIMHPLHSLVNAAW
jgi:hypothetical protein